METGDKIAGRYVLREKLGQGGFASVYEAWDESVGRVVAIKCMDVSGVNDAASEQGVLLERFRREARMAATLRHPNIIEIHDIGELDDDPSRPFIVMEKLEGYDLGDQIERHGALPPERLFPLMIAALDALGEAHKAGIVHKDLKPSNLFLSRPDSRAEQIKIVDFGIAYLHAPLTADGTSPERLTENGQLLGTPQYLAPEYIDEQDVTSALDVYQMGLIIIELLMGAYLLEGKTSLQCLVAHTKGELEIPAAFMEGELGSFLRRALSKDPEYRFANGDEMAEALERLDPAAIDLSAVIQAARPISGQRTIAIGDITAPTEQLTAVAMADTIVMPATIPATETISVDPPPDTIAIPTREPTGGAGEDRVEARDAGLVIGGSLLAVAIIGALLIIVFAVGMILLRRSNQEPAPPAKPAPSITIEVDPEKAADWREQADKAWEKKREKEKKKKKKDRD